MGYYDFKTAGGGTKAYYLGEYESDAQIDVSAKYDGYAMLTSANFIVQPTGTTLAVQNNNQHRFDNGVPEGESVRFNYRGVATLSAPTISYNSSTGIMSFNETLAVTASGGIWSSYTEGSKSGSTKITAKVYLVTEIETV